MAVIETPMDARLAALSEELAGTVLPYGDASEQRELRHKLRLAAEAPAPAAAARLSYLDKSGEGAVSGRADLVDAVKNGKVKLDELDDDELPEPMQSMDAPQRDAYVQQVLEQREWDTNGEGAEDDKWEPRRQYVYGGIYMDACPP